MLWWHNERKQIECPESFKAEKLAITASYNDRYEGKSNLHSLYRDGLIDYAGPRQRDWRLRYYEEDLDHIDDLIG